MNCPNCGAENDPDARFCAECGTPLESEVDDTAAFNDDRTILSSASQIAEEAKTVSVTQEDVAALATELKDEATAPSEAEPEPPSSSPAAPSEEGVNGNGGLLTQRNIIIAVVVLILLCCFCMLVGIGGYMLVGLGFAVGTG